MASQTIVLAGEPRVDEQKSASAVITPGDLIEINAGQFRRHATAAGNAAPIFALERDEIGNDYTDNYAANDQVKAGYFKKGDKVNGWIASGQNLSDGDFVESDGSGGLRALAADAATDQSQRVSVVARADGASGAVVARTRHPFIIC